MDEFIPGNTDPERRGRVAYERMRAAVQARGRSMAGESWSGLEQPHREAWCHAAEAAFEEGCAFERERAEEAVRAKLDDVAIAAQDRLTREMVTAGETMDPGHQHCACTSSVLP